MTLLSWLIKASVVVAVTAVVQAILGRRISAAMRHAIWALTMVGLVLLPVFSFTLPDWRIAPPRTTERAVAALSNGVTPTRTSAICVWHFFSSPGFVARKPSSTRLFSLVESSARQASTQ